jgi:excinuclease ABC subunit C
MILLKKKIAALPRDPGVYFMKNAKAEVIYVGKAKDLKARVSSYFLDAKDHSPKTRKLVKDIVDFEVMLVTNEVEALLLERTLIKHHQPIYNILLRDDKEYPYLKVHFAEPWPRIEIVRKRKDDNATYFGPFASPASVRHGLAAAQKVFPMIRCSKWEFEHAKRVCNYYHMKLCLGPCVHKIAQEDYRQMIQNAVDLIMGRNEEVKKTLEQRMFDASSKELFTIAAQYRDQLRAIESLSERQSVMLDSHVDADVVILRRDRQWIGIHAQLIRQGKLMGGQTWVFDSFEEGQHLADHEQLVQFLLQYYDGRDLPKELFLEHHFDGIHSLALALSKNHDRAFSISPLEQKQNQDFDALKTMAIKNITYSIKEHESQAARGQSMLEELQKTLDLSHPPRRIECIDISNFQGTAIVASDVCFIDGHPSKENYRIYNIQTVTDAPDDFASIREVVTRRIERGLREENLPDLLVIDGGKGQLQAACDAKSSFPQLKLDIISLAKSRLQGDSSKKQPKFTQKDVHHSFERIFIPGRDVAIPLRAGSLTYRLLTQLRDEAHRFAITKHRAKRQKKASASPLDMIEGVGPKAKQILLKHFSSLESIKKATLEELSHVPGIKGSVAFKVFQHFATDEKDSLI